MVRPVFGGVDVQIERRADQRERLRQQEEQARAREERARQSALAETCRRDAEGRCHWDNKKEALPPANMANLSPRRIRDGSKCSAAGIKCRGRGKGRSRMLPEENGVASLT